MRYAKWIVVVAALMIGAGAAAGQRAAPPSPRPAATKPSRPPTYAELKAENDRLRQEIDQLKQDKEDLERKVDRLEHPGGKPTRKGIHPGMTLDDLKEVALDHRLALVSETEDAQQYRVPYLDGETTTIYLVWLKRGKVSTVRVEDAVTPPPPSRAVNSRGE